MLKVYAAHWALTSTLLSSAAQVFNPSYQIGLAKVSVLFLKRSPLIASYSPSPQQCVPPFFHFFSLPKQTYRAFLGFDCPNVELSGKLLNGWMT